MHIFVKTLDGKTIHLDIDWSTTAAEIKRRIYEKEGIPIAQQRLIVCGRDWQNQMTVHDIARVTGSATASGHDLRPHLVLRIPVNHTDLCSIIENGDPRNELDFVWMVHYYENNTSPFISSSQQFYASDSFEAAFETYQARLTTSSPSRKPYLAYVAIKKQDLAKARQSEASGKYKHTNPAAPQMKCYTIEDGPVNFETLIATAYLGGRYQTQYHPNQNFRYSLTRFQEANAALTQRISSIRQASTPTQFGAVQDLVIDAIVEAIEDTSREAVTAQLNLVLTAIRQNKPNLPLVPTQGISLGRLVLALMCDRGGLYDRTKYTLTDYVNGMEQMIINQIRLINNGANLSAQPQEEATPIPLDTKRIKFMASLDQIADLPMHPTDTVLMFKQKIGAMFAIPAASQIVCALGVELEDQWTLADIIRNVGPLENIPALYVDRKSNRVAQTAQAVVTKHTNQDKTQLSNLSWEDLSKVITADLKSTIGQATKPNRSIPISDYWNSLNATLRLQILNDPSVHALIDGITPEQMVSLEAQFLGTIPADRSTRPEPPATPSVVEVSRVGYFSPAAQPQRTQNPKEAAIQAIYATLNPAEKNSLVLRTQDARNNNAITGPTHEAVVKYLAMLSLPVAENMIAAARRDAANVTSQHPRR